MSKFKIITDKKQLLAAISEVGKSGKALDKMVHVAAVSCMAHAAQHGDVTLADRLINNLSKQSRANALRDWFTKYGQFTYNAEKKAFKFNSNKETDIQAAIDNPFWTIGERSEGGEYKPMDFDKALKVFIKRVEKAIDKGDTVDTDKFNQLKALAA